MSRFSKAIFFVLLVAGSAFAQAPPASDPQALAFAAQSIGVLTGGMNISDVTLTGTVTWNGTDTGNATLKALGSNESRMDLALAGGTRTEIRDSQTGAPLGEWINPDNTSGQFASQNCQTDAVWFFPALGSLAGRPNVVLSYIGQETRNRATVQHLQSYVYQSGWPARVSPSPQQLSTVDFYLDATTFLPVVVTFNVHPDADSSTNLLVEVDFSNYQGNGGVMVPTHVQKYQQGALLLDLTVTGSTFNSGLPLSTFTVN